MRGTARVGTVALAAGAAALLLSGCGPVNAGSAAEARFVEAVHADHAEWVEAFHVSANNTLPFSGDANGSVVLRDDTPIEVFAEVLDLVTQYPDDDFVASGVEANGVGVCIDDPQADGRQALRDALLEAGESLAGDWPCPPRPDHDRPPYRASLDELEADLERIRALGGATGLELDASIDMPNGTITAPLDAVPATLGDTLRAIGSTVELRRFELVGTDLAVAVSPTADVDAVQAAADAAAGGQLQVLVMLGSMSEADQEAYAELAPLLDELRAIPGVERVDAQTQAVTLITLDAAQLRAIHDAAVADGRLDALGLTIEVGEQGAPMGAHRYFRPAGGQSAHIDDFVALVAAPGVTQVELIEAGGGRDRWVTLDTDGTMLDAAQLKPLLPTGVAVQLASTPDDAALRFVVADRLTPEELSDLQDKVDLEAFAAAWNAIP